MDGAGENTDALLDAAIERLSEPGRLEDAQRTVSQNTPGLQRILARALEEGGWFDGAHDQAVRSALAEVDEVARERAIRTLLAEETRVGMFVGVTVGLELARLLAEPLDDKNEGETIR